MLFTTMIVNSPHQGLKGINGNRTVDIVTVPFGPVQVVVESESPALALCLLRIYSGAVTPGTPDDLISATCNRITYTIAREATDEGHDPVYSVTRDGEAQDWHYTSQELTSYLEWDISGAVSKSLASYHRIHAAALAYNGHGILLPGASGSGKSTTAAALALHGFIYCSDEYAMVGTDARLYPFPKIISLKLGGWRQVALDFPEKVSLLGWPDVSSNGVRLVKAPVVPDRRQSQAGYPIDFVIVPYYQPEQPTVLEPISKSLALRGLIEQSLDLQLRGNEGLEMLVNLVRRADCYSLSISSLKQASELVKELTL